MSKFILENLLPNQEYLFKISKTLNDEEISCDFKLETPKFATRMDKVDLTYKRETSIKTFVLNNSASYFITKFVVKSKTGNKSTTRFFITSSTGKFAGLAKDNKISFLTSAASALANFNSSSAIIRSVSFDTSQKYVDVINMVSSSFTPSSSGNVGSTQSYPSPYTNNCFVEFKRQSQKDVFTITIDGGNKFIINELMWKKDYVKDMIIFAYASVDTPNKTVAQIKERYIVGNNGAIDSKTPPAYATVEPLFAQKPSVTHTQNWSDASKAGAVYFWAAIARYKKINGTWVGEWLHLDDNKDVIWTKVAKEFKG